jgi:hypothetical protein
VSTPLLIPEPPLQVLPQLAREIGLNEAIVLQQVHYRQQRGEGVRDGWLRRTYREWLRDFPFWGTRTIERIFNSLRAKDLLLVEDGAGTDRALRYRVNYEAVPSRQLDVMESANLARQSGVMSMEREKSTSPKGEDKSFSAQATEVFEHWKTVHNKNGSTKFGAKRKRAVIARLKEGRSVDFLKRAVDGNAGSEWHREHRQHELELVMRDELHVERFAAICEDSDTTRNGNGLHLKNSRSDLSIYDKGIIDLT